MESNIIAARNYGYIKVPDSFLITNPEQAKKLPASETLILCTGSQGEPLAALSRMAFNQHKQIKINPGDTVVFSSSPIPGNNAAINKLVNQLTRDGAKVLVNSTTNHLHASGHPCKQELRFVQSIVKPKYFMPIHGDYYMLKLHKDIAIECGLNKDHIFVCANGDEVILDNHKCRYGEKINVDVEYLDSVESFGVSTSIIKDRELLSKNGLVNVLVLIKDNKIKTLPIINTKGFSYYITSESNYIKELQAILINQCNKELENNNINIKHTIEGLCSRYFYKITRRTPVVVSQIINY